jgi:hypothetical protein
MGLLSYLRKIGKTPGGECPTPVAVAAAAAEEDDENEDFFVTNLKRFASVKNRNHEITNNLGIDLSLFKPAPAAAPAAAPPAAAPPAAAAPADAFPADAGNPKEKLTVEFLKRLKSGKHLGSLSAASIVWSTHMAIPEGITKGQAWNMTSGCDPCGGDKSSISCSAHKGNIHKLAPKLQEDSTKSFDELKKELNLYIEKFTDSPDDETAKISYTGILMCIADILSDFQLIFEEELSHEDKTELKGILSTKESILAQIRVMYPDSELTTFISTVTAGGGKRARRVRRTKRTKGKSRGRARKATRVRRNNNNNSNKTKRNKGKKRRTKRA